jgi:hypothetical protein
MPIPQHIAASSPSPTPVQVLTSNQSSKAADVYAFGVMCWVSARAAGYADQGSKLEGPCIAGHMRAGQWIHLFMAGCTTLNSTMCPSEMKLTSAGAVTCRSCGTSALLWTSCQLQLSPTLPLLVPLPWGCLSWCQSCCALRVYLHLQTLVQHQWKM